MIEMKKSAAYKVACVFILLLAMSGCGVMNSPKYQLSDGFYKSSAFETQSKKVFIDNTDDTVFVYNVDKKSGLLDTVRINSFPQVSSLASVKTAYFRQASLDIDFLTIPFKYRPTRHGFPNQFNTNLNGAVYLGHRNDIYQLSFRKTPLNKFNRQTSHYGISYGVFTGFGGTAMNPSVTNNQVLLEYDGFVWGKGIAGIIGINNFTIGLAVGFDNLLDKNKKLWIYQGQPWLGLAFGLNLN
jgi:hypothetical protein